MSFYLDYYCYYPRFLGREACAYSEDPDQMAHNTLCNQGIQGFTLSQQSLEKSVGTIMAL